MNRRISLSGCGFLLACTITPLPADVPELHLGPKPSFGLFQPRVSVEVFADADGQQSLGPESSSFLLDTGASGIVVYPPASSELADQGFINEGEFEEVGIAGTDIFQVSAPYRVEYAGTSGEALPLQDVRLLSGDSAPDPTGLMSLHGIVGMPAMKGRVTSLDNRTREAALPLSMGVTFSDQLPPTATHRFTVPLDELAFPAEGDGPLPTFESLATLEVISQHGNQTSSNSIVLDSGAQFTIFSNQIALDLGLDANGNGDLFDEAITTVPLSGASGQIQAPVLAIDHVRIPTDQGFQLGWSNAEVVILDIHPRIAGVLGADFMTDDGGLDLSLLGGGTGGISELLGSLLGGEGLNLEDLLGDLLGGGLDLGDLLGGGGGLDLGGLLGGSDLGGLLGGLGGVAGADDGFGNPLQDLLDELLGGGLGGDDLFASFPLNSYFDQVHFDFREFPQHGQLVFDVNADISARILNGDHVFDVADIDDLTQALDTDDLRYDLNGDGQVDRRDRNVLVHDVFQTRPGDADLDGDVDFADFLALSQSFGTAATGWGTGDFDGDGATGFADFLALSENFGQGPVATAIPEPSGGSLSLMALLLMQASLRRVLR